MDNNEYTGYCYWIPGEKALETFYQYDLLPSEIQLKNNQYLIIKNEKGQDIDLYQRQGNDIVRINYPIIGSKEFEIMKPRNPEQKCAFHALLNPNTTIKYISGTWGSGKTSAIVTAAIQLLQQNKYDKIVWVRNNIETKDCTPIGSLPGDLFDKLLPYLGPFIDHCTEEYTQQLIERDQLVVEHLGFLRGRDFKHSILIVTEAENLTLQQIQLIIARLGEGSILMIDADVRQRDKTVFIKSRGVETMVERLAGNELFETVKLVKTERSATASLADLLD